MLNVNVMGTFLCTREAIKIFKAQNPQGGEYTTMNQMQMTVNVAFTFLRAYHQQRFDFRLYTTRPFGPVHLSRNRLRSMVETSISLVPKSTLASRDNSRLDHGFLTPLTSTGNAITPMAEGHDVGTRQANGQVIPEPMFDVGHVGDAIAHIVGLPLAVTVLTFNIM